MGSCRGLVRVSGPCTSVCCESHGIWHCPKIFFFFSFFCFFVFILLDFSMDSSFPFFHSLISLGFWCTSFYHQTLSTISRTYSRISRLFRIFRFARRSYFCIGTIIYLFLSFPLSPTIWLVRHFVLYIRHFSCFVSFRVALSCLVFSLLISSHIFSSLVPLPLFLFLVLAFIVTVSHRRHC